VLFRSDIFPTTPPPPPKNHGGYTGNELNQAIEDKKKKSNAKVGITRILIVATIFLQIIVSTYIISKLLGHPPQSSYNEIIAILYTTYLLFFIASLIVYGVIIGKIDRSKKRKIIERIVISAIGLASINFDGLTPITIILLVYIFIEIGKAKD
jgi:cytochrome c oxidase assembly factor CtaG